MVLGDSVAVAAWVRVGTLWDGDVGITLFNSFESDACLDSDPCRNAVDGNDAPWTAGVPWPVPFAGHTAQWCPISHATDPKKLSGSNGQACYW